MSIDTGKVVKLPIEVDNFILGDFDLIYENSWNGYEEWGGVRIYQKDSEYFEQNGGYSVMAESNEPPWFDAYPISLERALEIIEEWEEIVKDFENNC